MVTMLVTVGSVGIYLYETSLDGGDDGEQKERYSRAHTHTHTRLTGLDIRICGEREISLERERGEREGERE